jgi:hypothetical protein
MKQVLGRLKIWKMCGLEVGSGVTETGRRM